MRTYVPSLVLLSTAFLSATLGTSVEKRGACPAHYKKYNNLCFRFHEDKKNWDQAKAQCKAEGGMLANTQAHDVYNFVRKEIEANRVKATVFLLMGWENGWWIGARKSGGHFKWLNGQPLTIRWYAGMPDNGAFGMGHEDCVEQMASNFGWNDFPCNSRLRYICQKTANPCTGFNCGKGRCVVKGAKATCACNKGWTGSTCGVIVDPCKGVNCGNGKCVADKKIGGSPRCACSKGWTGEICNIVVDPCKGVNCGNGQCVADKKIGGSARCACSKGWTGVRCNDVVDPCQGVKCNHGKCVADKKIGGTARCICNSGWTGVKCDAIPNLCAKNPCKNGGKCVNRGKPGRPDYHCLCPKNAKGRNCEKFCKFDVNKAGFPVKMDAMILFDGSGSVEQTPGGWSNTLGFISEIMGDLDLAADKTRLELVQFSWDPEVELDFRASVKMSKAALKKKVAGIEIMNSQTWTAKALKKAYDLFKTKGRKDKDVVKLLLVLTDGESNDGDKIPAAIKKLKSLGVETVAVGVGKGANAEELKQIAGGNEKRVSNAESFDKLDHDLITKMVKNICA